MRRKYQITRNRVQLHNRLESLLEEAHIKLSSLVSDLLPSNAATHASKTGLVDNFHRAARARAASAH